MKEQIINKIERAKIIVDVEGIYGEPCAMLVKALRSGGIEVVELVLADRNHQKVWDTINYLRQMGTLVTVGVGNVRTAHEVQMAKAYGAEFVSSYISDAAVIHAANDLGIVVIPGALTPSEIVMAHRTGADFVKVFPTASMGPAYFKDIRPAIKDISIFACGGITRPNVRLYEHAGATGMFVDDTLFSEEQVNNGDWEQIRENARRFVSTL